MKWWKEWLYYIVLQWQYMRWFHETWSNETLPMKLNDVWYQIRLRCSLQGGHEPWCARHQQDLSETNILRSGGWMCLWESDHVMTHDNFNPICFGWNCVSKNCVYIHVYVIANEDSKMLISLFPSWFFCTEATKNHAASLQTRWHPWDSSPRENGHTGRAKHYFGLSNLAETKNIWW